MKNKSWTDSDIAFIEKAYPTTAAKVIAQRLGVPASKVQGAIKRFQIQKHPTGVKKRSTNDVDPYMKGYSFWSENAFWRNAKFSKKGQEYFENSLEEMRKGDRVLTRVQG